MYRTPASPPVGEWARFLDRLHAEKGWSLQRAFKELHVGLGLSENSRASYDALAKGKRQPKPRERDYLTAEFGGPTEQDRQAPVVAPPADTAALIAAIAAQTAAISELVVELRRVADGQVGQSNALGQLATLALGIRTPPELPTETPARQSADGPHPRSGRR